MLQLQAKRLAHGCEAVSDFNCPTYKTRQAKLNLPWLQRIVACVRPPSAALFRFSMGSKMQLIYLFLPPV